MGIKLLNRLILSFSNLNNFVIISEILLIHSAVVMSKLKLPVTISCVALFFWTKNKTP